MTLTPEEREKLQLIKTTAARVGRESKMLKTWAAQLLDGTAADTSTAEEAHENDTDRDPGEARRDAR